MTVTYLPLKGFPGVQIPKLHRVVYAETVDDVCAQYQRSLKDVRVDEWCRSNCQHPWYRSPGYLKQKFIEFECDQEAVMFALRWS